MAIARVACSIWTCWHTLRITGATSRKHCIHTSAVICVGYMYCFGRCKQGHCSAQSETGRNRVSRDHPCPTNERKVKQGHKTASCRSFQSHDESSVDDGEWHRRYVPFAETGRATAERSVAAPLRGDKVVASRVSCEKKVTSSHPSGQLKLSCRMGWRGATCMTRCSVGGRIAVC